MKISEKNFILVTESGSNIIVDDYLEELLRKEMRPILWFRDGLFSVVPEAVLQNVLDSIDWVKRNAADETTNVNIHWSQTFHIDDEAGRSLLGSEN